MSGYDQPMAAPGWEVESGKKNPDGTDAPVTWSPATSAPHELGDRSYNAVRDAVDAATDKGREVADQTLGATVSFERPESKAIDEVNDETNLLKLRELKANEGTELIKVHEKYDFMSIDN